MLCRWGAISEIVTDNGAAFVSAVRDLQKRFKIHHISISPYNSKANGIVEHSHFDTCQVLYKIVGGEQHKWGQGAHFAFWAERVTVRKRMGCSPYFAVTGCHPVLPLDVVEATYLSPAPDRLLNTGDLIVRRAVELQRRHEQLVRLNSKVFRARVEAARKFERDHQHTIRDYDFKARALVLMRHTQIEKSLNRKMRAQYTGPLVVVSRNRGGAYVLCKLDGSVLHRAVGAFRLIPYLARTEIPLPSNFADISDKCLAELVDSEDDKRRTSRRTSRLAISSHGRTLSIQRATITFFVLWTSGLCPPFFFVLTCLALLQYTYLFRRRGSSLTFVLAS